jgi:hypothetical protein
MRRLTIRQLLFAAVVGALFATLQGDPPVPGLARFVLACPSVGASGC